MATFARMSVTFVAGLFVTRLLIRYLGSQDYGVLMVLGASGGFLTLLTAAFTLSAQRHLAYALGLGDLEKHRVVFNTVLVIFFTVGTTLIVVGWLIGPLLLSVLDIPEARSDAAYWAYHVTLVSMALGAWTTPYTAAATAHQEMVYLAVVDGLLAAGRFAAALALGFLGGDLLVWFVMLVFIANLTSRMLLVAMCLIKFPETRPHPSRLQWSEVREVGAYAGWSLVGQIGWKMRSQGGVILINLFFGPLINAAYAISIQVIGYFSNFSMAIIRAVQPVIVAAEARGHRQQVHTLNLLTGKYASILLSFLMIPLWLDTDNVLHLWLGQPPPYSALFVQLVLGWSFMEQISMGYGVALGATGNIGWYSRSVLVLSGLVLLAAWVGFSVFGLGPWFLPVMTITMYAVLLWQKVVIIGRMIELSPSVWVKKVLTPTMVVIASGSAAIVPVRLMMPEQALRLLVECVVYAAVASPLVWFVGLEAWEREHFTRVAGGALKRLRPNTAG